MKAKSKGTISRADIERSIGHQILSSIPFMNSPAVVGRFIIYYDEAEDSISFHLVKVSQYVPGKSAPSKFYRVGDEDEDEPSDDVVDKLNGELKLNLKKFKPSYFG